MSANLFEAGPGQAAQRKPMVSEEGAAAFLTACPEQWPQFPADELDLFFFAEMHQL